MCLRALTCYKLVINSQILFMLFVLHARAMGRIQRASDGAITLPVLQPNLI